MEIFSPKNRESSARPAYKKFVLKILGTHESLTSAPQRFLKQWTFLACMFCFPNTDHVMFSRKLAWIRIRISQSFVAVALKPP